MARRDEEQWLEHQIHDDTNEDESPVFDLFAKEVPYETVEFEFPNVPKISIQTQTETPTSTGLALWLGSETMCTYVAKNQTLISGKKVLELGAGVGLCGIVSSHLGASHVVLTDGDSSVLDNLRRNTKDNMEGIRESSMSCRQLIWGKKLETFDKFDVILAGDCAYMNKSLGPLWQTIHQLLTKEGLLIYVNLCASQGPLEMVLEKASSFGFVWNQPEDSVYLFRRKSLE